MAVTTDIPKSILLLGSGAIGSPILAQLVQSPHRPSSTSITLTSRNPQANIAALATDLHVEALSMDIPALSESELAAAFAGYSIVIGCTGMYFPPGTQVKILRAILAAGVPRYIPWQFGVDYDQMRESGSSQDRFMEQVQVRDLLRAQQKTKWAIFSNGIFADFLMGEAAGFGVVESRGAGKFVVRALGTWDNRVTATKVEDIAIAVETIVLVDRDVEGLVYLAGQTVSYKDVATAVEAVVGKDNVKTEEWTADYLVELLGQDPHNEIRKYRAAFAAGTGMSWDEERTWNRQKGVKFASLDDWVQEYTLMKV